MIHSKKLIQKVNRPAPDTSSRSKHFRFDRNERTTLFTDEEFQSMLSALTPYDFVAYGELEPFYEKITKWLNVERENILLTSGSDMGIKSLFETYINKGDKVLISLPNYAMFSVYNKMFGGIEKIQWYCEDFTLDVNSLLENMTDDLKLVIISNPGHTGKVVQENDLLRIIERAQANNTLVLVDEAYHHFYPGTMIGYINKFENLIITRTFSKAFGLASLRIGLLIARKELIDDLYRVKLVHEITGVAAKIGSYMLDNMGILEKYIQEVNLGKSLLYKKLFQMGIQVYESESNFMFFKLPEKINSVDLVRYLEERNIYIKGPFTNTPFMGQLRITVGDSEQMDIFCNEVENYLNKCN